MATLLAEVTQLTGWTARRRKVIIKKKRFVLIGQFVLVSPEWCVGLRSGPVAGKIRFIACWCRARACDGQILSVDVRYEIA